LAPAASASGAWKIQLGAFGVASNADALWNRIKGRPELAGHPRINARAGAVTKLQAGGFASQAEAQSACSRLTSAGFTCIATR
jgi:cell division septation protein DedD